MRSGLQLQRVVAAARLFGLAPYRWSGQAESDRFEPSTPWRVCSQIIVCFCFAISQAVQWTSQEHFVVLTSLAAQFGALITVALFVTWMWCLPVRQYRLLGRILNSRIVQDCSGEASMAFTLAIFLSRSCGFLLPVLSFIRSGEYLSALRRLSLSPWVLVQGAELSFIAFLLSCITVQYQRLNAALRRLPAGTSTTTTSSTAWAIALLRREHKQTQLLIDALMDCFGLQTLCLVLLQLWWITTKGFFSLVVIKSSDARRSALAMCDFLQSSIWVVCFVEVAHRTAREGNSSMSIIHQLRNRHQVSKDEEVELDCFSLQLTQEPANVSLCQIIDLNRKVIFQAGAAVLSYIVILLQFQQDLNEDSTISADGSDATQHVD